MSIYESVHPLGQEVETIHNALLSGMLDDESIMKAIPPHLKLNYQDPISSGDGVGVLRIADWESENMTGIFFPVAVAEEETSDWVHKVVNDDVPERKVSHRLFTKDLLGRGFPVHTELGKQCLSDFLRFDVVEDGVIFIASEKEELLPIYGKYESENYDLITRIAHSQSSVRAILDLAQRY